MEQLLKVGIISSTHGIRGEVKVFPTTDDINRFKKLKKCILVTKEGNMDLEVEGCKFFKQFAILKFKGIDSINDIEKYKQCELYVTRENAVKLKKDEYFICDIVGSIVIDDENNTIGTLDDVMKTGANDVYIVKKDDGKEVLFPAIKECVLNVNVEEKIITVHVMKGLMD